MKNILLIPMSLCLMVSFMFLGIFISKNWSGPKVFYPKTLSVLREKMLRDNNGRYVYQRFETWCSVVGGQMTPEDYLVVSLIGAVVSFSIGLLVGNITISISLFLLFLLSPSLILYARYMIRVNKMIKSFGHFVDLFARHYSTRKNIVLAFRDMAGECPKELYDELIVLNNKLTDGGNSLHAIESFADRLNHVWAYDFAMYISSGLEGETEDIQSALNRLTGEMFVHQDEREERQSEIYSIWISLIIVIVICILLIPYNQTLMKESYRLYFFTPDGQALLSIAATVWFLSVLVAFIWGKRHM